MNRRYRWLVLGLVTPQVSSVLIVAVTAWVLGPAGRGEVAFAQGTASMLAVIGGWGFYLSAAVFADAEANSLYLRFTISFTAGISLVMILCASVAPLGLLSVTMAVPISLAAVMVAGTTYVQRLVQALASDAEYLVLAVVPSSISLLTVLPTVLLGGSPLIVVCVWAAGTVLSFAIARLRVRKRVAMSWGRSRSLFSYAQAGFRVGAANVTSFLILRSDTFVLGVASTAEQVGYYSVAVAISGLLLYIPEAVSLRTISSYGSTDRRGYVRSTFGSALKAASLVLAAAVPLVAVGWVLLNQVFDQFAPAFPAFVLLCLAGAPASIVRVLVSAASMLGLSTLLGRYSLLNVFLLVGYVPAAGYGAAALALVSLVAYTVQALFVYSGLRGIRRDSTGEG